MTHPHELGKHHSDTWWESFGARTGTPRCTFIKPNGARCSAVALFDGSCGRHGYRPTGTYDLLGIVRASTRTRRTR